MLILLIELFSPVLQFYSVYVRRIAGSPSEGWNKILNRSCIEYK